jgi:dynein heavy chain
LQLIDGHINSFEPDVAKLSNKIVDATIELHRNVMNNFLPSAVKFHYQFNLREMTNMTQGICRMIKEYYREPLKVARLWVHEAERVFR